MQAKLSVRNLFKIFGSQPERALDLLRRSESKQAIFKALGAIVGVDDVSFDVDQGEIFVVMGLSGSGKSTLVRMLNGLLSPTSGTILVDAEDIARCSKGELRRIQREKIAMVFQHFALFPHWTVAENAAYGLKIKGVPVDERRRSALTALQQVGLDDRADSLPSELSGGMQQRVGLARGLATGAQILLMDEPFGALDPLIRRDMQNELIKLQKTLKKTIVFITHDLDEALMLGDKIAIMKDGRIVQVGTAQEIVAAPADDYVAAFVSDIDRGRVFRACDVAAEPGAVQLRQHGAGDAMRRMEELGRDALYVLEGERVAGLVIYKDLTSRSGTDGIAASLVADYPVVTKDVYLCDLYGKASAGLPIAVMEDGRLVGVVAPEAVLAQLSPDLNAQRAADTRRRAVGEAAHV